MTDSSVQEENEQRIPCRNCLLEDLSNRSLYERILETVAAIPEDRRAGEAEYRRRLLICRQCDRLFMGTCRECGCYVEVRAARTAAACPAPKPKW